MRKREEEKGLRHIHVTPETLRALVLARLEPPPPAPDPHVTHGGGHEAVHHTQLGYLHVDLQLELARDHLGLHQDSHQNRCLGIKDIIVHVHPVDHVVGNVHILVVIQGHRQAAVVLLIQEVTLLIPVHHQVLHHHPFPALHQALQDLDVGVLILLLLAEEGRTLVHLTEEELTEDSHLLSKSGLNRYHIRRQLKS